MVDETEHICRSRRPISTCCQVLQPPDAQPPDVQPPDARFQPVSSVSPAHRSSPPGCRSLCSSPARDLHLRAACIHSELIEYELGPLISVIIGTTLAVGGGGRSRSGCSASGCRCGPCRCWQQPSAAVDSRSSSTRRVGERVVAPAALQAPPPSRGRAARRPSGPRLRPGACCGGAPACRSDRGSVCMGATMKR